MRNFIHTSLRGQAKVALGLVGRALRRRLGSWGEAILVLLPQISSLLLAWVLVGLGRSPKVYKVSIFSLFVTGLTVVTLGGCGEPNQAHDASVSAPAVAEAVSSTQETPSLVTNAQRKSKLNPSEAPHKAEGVEGQAEGEDETHDSPSTDVKSLEGQPKELKSQAQVLKGGTGGDQGGEEETNESQTPKKPKKPKKPERCRRGIHKGAKRCQVKRFHINIRQVNRGIKYKDLKLIGERRNITKEGRKKMLELLGDWRSKETCSYGYTFNFEYSGRASWRMYDCYVQDRLLWYLYLIGHHFDSELQVLSGLRANERKSSRHHNGHAVDFRVAGVSPKEVWEYCKKTFPLVGIGYYPKSKFVHLDVGRDSHQAYWVDSSGSGESAQYKSGVSQVQRGRASKSQAGMIRSIKGMLNRHHKAFKAQQSSWRARKKAREARAKRRRARRKKSKKRR